MWSALMAPDGWVSRGVRVRVPCSGEHAVVMQRMLRFRRGPGARSVPPLPFTLRNKRRGGHLTERARRAYLQPVIEQRQNGNDILHLLGACRTLLRVQPVHQIVA